MIEVPPVDHLIRMNARISGMDVRGVQASVKLGLLDSALRSPSAGFGGVDLYPEAWQQLGVLCSRLVLNHPFIDGNTPIGFAAMLRAAHLSRIPFAFANQDEAADHVLALAAGELSEKEFCDWIREQIDVDETS